MQFIKVTLSIRPDITVIIPKQKVMEVRGSKVIGTECTITYEVRGNLAVIEVLEDVDSVHRMLNA